MKNKKLKYLFHFVFFTCVIILNIHLLSICLKPRIVVELNGEELLDLDIYSEYNEQGITFHKNDEEIKDFDLKVDNNIDNLHIGEYEAVYYANYEGETYKLIRKINVKDKTPPVITTTRDSVYKYYCNENVQDSINYQAYDNYDGFISNKVKVDRKDDYVELSVSDSSGNNASKKLNYEVVDKVPPVIDLNGSEVMYVSKGSEYKEQGTSVKDGCGRKVEATVLTEGVVDTNTPGEYIITYTAVLDNMTSIITRKVIVYDRYIPELKEHYDGTGKTVYLTFDDGPGELTEEFLKVLDKYNAKATFFVTGQFPKFEHLIKEESEKGHSIAVHTYSHRYGNVYASVENYIKDFDDMNAIIERQTGSKTTMFRFPGGSSNTISRSVSRGIMSALSSKMQELGYVYYDWNVDSGDGAGKGKDKIIENVLNGVHSKDTSIVLCHDIHKSTLDALPVILETLTKEGYTFKGLTPESPKAHHGINN